MVKRDRAPPIERTGYEINKQDVASSQLATAIWLWAHQWDPVSVHVLASAAAEIISVLRSAKDGPSARSEVLDGLNSDFSDQVESYFRDSFNFMKHGAKDANAVLKFNPNESEWVIYHACVDYLHTFGVAPPEASFFIVYMTDEWPWLLKAGGSDPVRELREMERSKASAGKVKRKDVAASLMKLHEFAAYLRNNGQHDHPLIKTTPQG